MCKPQTLCGNPLENGKKSEKKSAGTEEEEGEHQEHHHQQQQQQRQNRCIKCGTQKKHGKISRKGRQNRSEKNTAYIHPVHAVH